MQLKKLIVLVATLSCFSNAFGQDDLVDAKRGFIATFPNLTIKNNQGQVIWALQPYEFLSKPQPPATINASLWRQAKLNMNNGLYKVTERVYQVRGFDLSNMDIIESDNGIIVIDPLISEETARAALQLYFQHRPRKPVIAVIYTHSHVDHYGGVKGVVNEADVKAGKVQVLAPEGFMQHAISENVYAGNAMGRRSVYMYGALLPKGEKGQVDGGLGKTVSLGTVTLIPPTDIIKKTGEKRIIDGVEIVFQMAPNTEAPSEMLMYFPQFKALCTAEDATHTLHNLYTLRGAAVRDAAAWWKTLNTSIELFGAKTEVVFAQHHWPMWGNADVVKFLQLQRDLYKYINDQSLRLLNQGYTMTEIGNMLQLPASLATPWYNHDYYGSVNHDAKAVYQRYLGWYDSNPANLHPLSPVEASKKYVEFMGGASAVIAKARDAYAKKEYRWAAQVLNHVVFADPSNQEAKNLEADAFEQMGFQCENPTWRNEYLMGAYELRHGVDKTVSTQTASPDTIRAMPLDMYFDYLGMHLDNVKAANKHIVLNFNFTDSNEHYAVQIENSVLIYTPNKTLQNADASITLTRQTLDSINLHQTTFDKELAGGRIKIVGSAAEIKEFLSLFDTFDPAFNIVTP